MFDTNVRFFTAVVTDVKDKDKKGRVQVRIHGYMDDTNKIQQKDLPWAEPIMPITTAGHNKIGQSPTGIVVGSTVVGFWGDGPQGRQIPFYVGTINQAGEKEKDKDKAGYGRLNSNEKKKNSTPLAGRPEDQKEKNKTNTQIGVDQKQKDKPKDTPVNNSDDDAKNSSKASRDQSPHKDTPTVIAKKAMTDVLGLIKAVDPSNKLVVIPQAVDAIKRIEAAAALGGIGGIASILQGALTGALASIANASGIGVLGNLFQILASPQGMNALNAFDDAIKVAVFSSMGEVATAYKNGTLLEYIIVEPTPKTEGPVNRNVPNHLVVTEDEIPNGWEEVITLENQSFEINPSIISNTNITFTRSNGQTVTAQTVGFVQLSNNIFNVGDHIFYRKDEDRSFILYDKDGVEPVSDYIPKFVRSEEIVRAAYAKIGRSDNTPYPVDQAGLNYWIEQLESGVITEENIDQVFYDVIVSDINKNPTDLYYIFVANFIGYKIEISNEQFVRNQYYKIGRTEDSKYPPDEPGVNYWVGQLENGNLDRTSFIAVFNTGVITEINNNPDKEYAKFLNDNIGLPNAYPMVTNATQSTYLATVLNAYASVGRSFNSPYPPDDAGVRFWFDELDKGILTTDNFNERFWTVIDEGIQENPDDPYWMYIAEFLRVNNKTGFEFTPVNVLVTGGTAIYNVMKKNKRYYVVFSGDIEIEDGVFVNGIKISSTPGGKPLQFKTNEDEDGHYFETPDLYDGYVKWINNTFDYLNYDIVQNAETALKNPPLIKINVDGVQQIDYTRYPYLFTIRQKNDHIGDPIETLSNELQINIAGKLYRILSNPQNLTVEQIIAILTQSVDYANNLATQKSLGKGAAIGALIGLAAQLIPVVGSLVQSLSSNQLPKSFLNQGDVSRALQEFTKETGTMLKKKQAEAEKIFSAGGFGSVLGALGSVASVVGIGGSIGVNIGGISASIKVSNLKSGANVNIPGLGGIGVKF